MQSPRANYILEQLQKIGLAEKRVNLWDKPTFFRKPDHEAPLSELAPSKRYTRVARFIDKTPRIIGWKYRRDAERAG